MPEPPEKRKIKNEPLPPPEPPDKRKVKNEPPEPPERIQV